MFRIGIGQDSHRFSKDNSKKLILGGFAIEGVTGFEANSDGDVVIHALCNALESAIGNKSFSTYADKMCQDGTTDSSEYLKVALSHIQQKGYQINNVSISIECKKPKILPIHDNLVDSLSALLTIEKDKIGITATTGEELTAFGQGLGVQVFVIVSLIKS